MSTAPETTDSKQADQQAFEQRPLYALCRSTLRLAAPIEGQTKTSGGRWCINGGELMTTRVWGVNMKNGPWGPEPEPIRLVVDLDSFEFDTPKIRAFDGHWEVKSCILGWWTDPKRTATGLEANLTWFEPKRDEAKQAAMAVALTRDLVEAGDPMEASLGAYPRDGVEGYEAIDAGETIDVNGGKITADGEMPTFVLRNGRASETSLVMWGASRLTGQLAASRSKPKDPVMTDPVVPTIACSRIGTLHTKLAGANATMLLACLGALAAGKLDAEVDTVVEQARLTAENADLKAKLEATKVAPVVPPAPVVPQPDQANAVKAAAESGTAPVVRAAGTSTAIDDGETPATVEAGMAKLAAAGSKLRGFDLKNAALRQWPDLRKTVPNAIEKKG